MAARASSTFAPARSAPRAGLPSPLSSLPLKCQEYPPLYHFLAHKVSLRFSIPLSNGGNRRRRRRVGGAMVDEAFEPGAGTEGLEVAIYEFMQRSANPSSFPTREELVAAGRADLAEAIATHGGWLAFGWDLDDEEEKNDALDSVEMISRERISQEDSIISQETITFHESLRTESKEVGSMASSSGRSMTGTEGGEGLGIEGILSGLERERNLALAIGEREKEVNGQSSWQSDRHNLGDNAVEVVSNEAEKRSGYASAEIVSNEDDEKKHGRAFPSDVPVDDKIHKLTKNAKETGNEMNELSSDAKKNNQNQIRQRLQHLESELTSALHSLRSRTTEGLSHKVQESSSKELHRLSDAWEFQETEIMYSQDKLRSIRAKLAVLEGKMALEIIEAQKIMEEKQKRLNSAQQALSLLRTVYIVWPNIASEVLLAGSFDGWTSQRRMESSTSGLFSLYMKLYPGRYEIKFIVDGVWQVDPLRPIVHKNGYQNNLLIVE